MKAEKQTTAAEQRTWGGRFNASPAAMMTEYTDSQHYDRKMYAQDITASCAHARMLAKQGIISEKDAELIVAGLAQIRKEIESGTFTWQSSLEDVHMNIEARLVEIIGDAGKRLHTGRSRNDQVALTFRLHVAEQCPKWLEGCVRLCDVLCNLAALHVDDILPGCTHMQPAQPVSLGQYLLAWANMFRRDVARIESTLSRVRISPLGAAALAGATYPLDPHYVASEVGFEDVFNNSMDAVSDRDFVLDALYCASLIMMHLSRICEELIIWANPALAFVSLPDQFSTGSSIMPQKKNPDACELMRGKTGRVYGNLMAMLTVMRGLPLTYNRDMQEDKERFFDSDETVQASLAIMSAMLPALTFNTDRMVQACARGYLNATELADYLAGKGIPFRDAHHITGHAVALAEKLGLGLEQLPLQELKKIDSRIEEDVYKVLEYSACVRRRETPGGTGPKAVRAQLQDFHDWLAKFA